MKTSNFAQVINVSIIAPKQSRWSTHNILARTPLKLMISMGLSLISCLLLIRNLFVCVACHFLGPVQSLMIVQRSLCILCWTKILLGDSDNQLCILMFSVTAPRLFSEFVLDLSELKLLKYPYDFKSGISDVALANGSFKKFPFLGLLEIEMEVGFRYQFFLTFTSLFSDLITTLDFQFSLFALLISIFGFIW